jgi:phosphatidylinositol alpha-1,6-mannosyltransferase
VVGNDFLRPWCGYNLPLRCILYRLPGKQTKTAVQKWETSIRKERVIEYLKESHAVVANSAWTKDRLIERGVHPDRVSVIVGGVDTALFQPPANKRGIRAQLNLPAESLVLLTAGNLIVKKGIDTVLKVVADLAPRWPSLRYVVAGDGEERERLQERAADLGLGQRIRFAGRKDHAELSLLYQAADLYVQISQNETMGRTYFEAGACGLPVIAARVEGTTSVVRDNLNGLLVSNPLDQAEIRSKLELLLADETLRKRLGAEGLRMAREEFSWDRVGAAFERLLLAAAASPPHARIASPPS